VASRRGPVSSLDFTALTSKEVRAIVESEIPVGKANVNPDGIEVYLKANWKVILLVATILNVVNITSDSVLAWFFGSLYASSKPW